MQRAAFLCCHSVLSNHWYARCASCIVVLCVTIMSVLYVGQSFAGEGEQYLESEGAATVVFEETYRTMVDSGELLYLSSRGPGVRIDVLWQVCDTEDPDEGLIGIPKRTADIMINGITIDALRLAAARHETQEEFESNLVPDTDLRDHTNKYFSAIGVCVIKFSMLPPDKRAHNEALDRPRGLVD